MVRGHVLPVSLALVLGCMASAALADGQREPAKMPNPPERQAIEDLDRGMSRGAVRVHRQRHGYYHHRRHYADRGWNGRYGHYPRRHFFITGVSSYGVPGPVNVATVSYRTYVYYTPTYPSVSHGYPPYAYLYDLTGGPIYNKPCFC